MQKYADVVLDRKGNVVQGARVLVKTTAGANAALFSDNGITPMSNPVITDNLGRFAFYAENGRYNLQVYIGSVLFSVSNDILLEDPLDETPEVIDGGTIKNVALKNVTVDGFPWDGGIAPRVSALEAMASSGSVSAVTTEDYAIVSYFAQEADGSRMPSANCYVYEPDTETLVTTLQDASGGALANPFTAGGNGLVQFAAPNGRYDLRVVKGARDYRVRVQCNDVAGNVMAADLASAEGSKTVGHQDPYAPAYLKTVSDLLNGEDVSALRGIPKTEWDAIANRTTTLDVTSHIQALINEFGNAKKVGGIVLPYGALVINGLILNQRGLRVRGANKTMTHIYPTTGSNTFIIGENRIEVSDMWIRPRTYAQGTQSSIVCTPFKTQNVGGVNAALDELNLHDVICEDLIGPALEIVSPLRESHIYQNRFIGMSDKAAGKGVIYGNLNAAFADNSNYIWLRNNVFYRFGAPALDLRGAGIGSKNYYDNWRISKNLFHNQLLDITLRPGGNAVVAEPTNTLFLQSGDLMYFEENTVTSFHSDYKGLLVETPNAAAEKNGRIIVKSGSVTGDDTVTGTNNGIAIHVKDAFATEVQGVGIRAGFQTVDIKVENTGAYAYTSRVDVSRNMSQNQFDVVVQLPATFKGVSQRAQDLTAVTASIGTVTITDVLKVKRSGRTVLSAGATTAVVTFASLGLPNMPNGNYDVYTQTVDQNLASWKSAGTASGFTINLASNPGTRTVAWLVNDPN
ncbi:hypothetical protein D3C76_48010 [compost metagenome]